MAEFARKLDMYNLLYSADSADVFRALTSGERWLAHKMTDRPHLSLFNSVGGWRLVK